MAVIKVATCAFPGTHDVAKSVELHFSYIEEAKNAGASLLVFPETSLQGYPSKAPALSTQQRLHELQRVAEPVPNGANVAKLIAAAAEQQIHVVFGLTESGPQPGVLYNTLVLAGPEGYIGSYRKVHVAVTERVFWRPGNEWPVFDTALGKIGMLICYDKMWPESCRELTLGGAEILVTSTAWSSRFGYARGDENPCTRQYNLFDRVRAVENARWLISSNFIGDLGGRDFFGFSQVVDPLGDVVATSGLDKVGLVVAEIDVPAGLARASTFIQGPFLIRDRRPETYARLRGDAPIVVDG